MRFAFFAAGLAFAAPAFAADPLEASLETCWSCHGAQGASNDHTIPIVWGQNAKYLEKQLRDFRGGDREDQIMSSMASSIKKDDVAKAAALIAAKAWPKRDPAAKAAPQAVEACKGCHGADLMGGDSPEGAAPRLAGQFTEYLAAQMDAFARGERRNQKTMEAMMKSLKPADRAGLAAYLGGL
jgi:cytochrome c553